MKELNRIQTLITFALITGFIIPLVGFICNVIAAIWLGSVPAEEEKKHATNLFLVVSILANLGAFYVWKQVNA